MTPVELHAALDALAPEPALDEALFDQVAARARRRHRWHVGTAVVGSVVAVMLAFPLAIEAVRPRETNTSRPAPTATVTPAVADAAHRAAAVRDVSARLAALPLPPDAERLPAAPARLPADLDQAPSPTGPNEVDSMRWFTLPDDVDAAFGWYAGHPPAGVVPSSPYAQPGGFDVSYVWPDQTGRVVNRSMDITVARDGDHLLMRVKAWAYWVPGRPPEVTIPAGVSAVTVVLHTKRPGMGDPSVPARTFGPITITDPRRVAAVVAFVNGLTMALPVQGPMSCPADFGGDMRVRFLDAAGRLVDQLDMPLSGCERTVVTAADGESAVLTGGADARIRSLLGLDWSWTV